MENNLTEKLLEIAGNFFDSQIVAKLFSSYGVDLDQLADLVVSTGKYPTDLSSKEASYFPSDKKILVNESFLADADDKVIQDVLYHELVHYVRDLKGLEYNGENKNTFEDPDELAAIFEDLRLKEKEGHDLLKYLQSRYPVESLATLNSVLERYTTTKLPKKAEFTVLSAPLMVALRLSAKYKETNNEFYLNLFIDNSIEFIKRAKFVFNQLPGSIYTPDKNAIRQMNEIFDAYLESSKIIPSASQLTLFDLLVDRIYNLVSTRPYINFKIGMLKEDIDQVGAFIQKIDSLKKIFYYYAVPSQQLNYIKINGIQGPIPLTKSIEMARFLAGISSDSPVFAIDSTKLNKDYLSIDPVIISDKDDYRTFLYNRSLSYQDFEPLIKTATLLSTGNPPLGWILPDGKFVSILNSDYEHVNYVINSPEKFEIDINSNEGLKFYNELSKIEEEDNYWKSVNFLLKKGWTRIAGIDEDHYLLINTYNWDSLKKIEDFIFKYSKDAEKLCVEFADGSIIEANVSDFLEHGWDSFSKYRVAASTKKLYHATYRPLLKSIKEEGLKAPSFWAQDSAQAESFAEVPVDIHGNDKDIPEEWLDEIVVFSIDPSKLDVKNLEIDPNLSTDEEDVRTFVYNRTIPYSDLSLLGKFAGLPQRSINPSSDSSPAYLYPQDLPTTKNPEQFSKVQNPDQDLAPGNRPAEYSTPSLRNTTQGNPNLVDVLESLEKEAASKNWFDYRIAGVITADGKMYNTSPEYDEHGDLLKKLKHDGIDTANALQFTTGGNDEFLIYAAIEEFSDAQWKTLEDFVFKNKHYKYVFYDRTVLVDDFIKSGESLKDYVANLKVFAEQINEPKQTIEQAGFRFDGYQETLDGPRLVLFTDPKTGSTLSLPEDAVSLENVIQKIKESRAIFERLGAKKESILDIAKRVRKNMLCTAGECISVSNTLAYLLNKAGYSADVVEGWFLTDYAAEGSSTGSSNRMDHNWVEVDGNILDITSDQFNYMMKTKLKEIEYPAKKSRYSEEIVEKYKPDMYYVNEKVARIDPMLEAYPETRTDELGESGTKFDYPRGITSLRPKSGESTGLADILESLESKETN